MEKYDAVIIGAGIGGLLCGALLSQKGYKVVVFEKEKYPGGLCSSFKNGGYTFDAAIDAIGSLKEGELLKNILRTLGIENKLDLIEMKPVRRNIFPDFYIDIPPDVYMYREKLKEMFHTEKQNLDNIFSLMEEGYEQSVLSVLGDANGERYGDRFKLRSWIGKSFQDLLNGYLNDLRLKVALSSCCTCLGLPASQVSAIAAVTALMHYIKGGAFRIRGGMQKLADLLVELIRCNSGKVFLGERVTRILTEKNKATGVVTNNGRYAIANYIISNMDLKTLVNSMIEDGVIDKNRLSRLNELEVSGPFVVVYLGTDLDLRQYNLTGSLGWFSSYEIDSMLNKNRDVFLGLNIPSILDDSIVPKGNHSLIIYWPLSQHKSVDKNEIADKLIKEVEHLIPELSRHIVLRRVADAGTFYRYTGNYEGAAYGWKQNAGFYANLPLFKNILDNFYVVGHWAGFGGGIMPSAISSLKVVEKITKGKIK